MVKIGFNSNKNNSKSIKYNSILLLIIPILLFLTIYFENINGYFLIFELLTLYFILNYITFAIVV